MVYNIELIPWPVSRGHLLLNTLYHISWSYVSWNVFYVTGQYIFRWQINWTYNNRNIYGNGNVIILMIFSSLAALEVVIWQLPMQPVMTKGKTPVRIIFWCPTTKMLIKACFLIQPLEKGGGCQKCRISLCSKVFINHFHQMKASPECVNILMYWSICLVDRLEKTLKKKSLNRKILSTDISILPLYSASSCPHRLQRS